MACSASVHRVSQYHTVAPIQMVSPLVQQPRPVWWCSPETLRTPFLALQAKNCCLNPDQPIKLYKGKDEEWCLKGFFEFFITKAVRQHTTHTLWRLDLRMHS